MSNAVDGEPHLQQPHIQLVGQQILERKFSKDNHRVDPVTKSDCWGFVDEKIGTELASRVASSVRKGLSEYENWDAYVADAKKISNKWCQSILGRSAIFDNKGDDPFHPFWVITKTFLGYIAYMSRNDWGFTAEQTAAMFAELGVASLNKQIKTWQNKNVTKMPKIQLQGDQCKLCIKRIHLLLIKGSYYIKAGSEVVYLLWATLWVFFIDFRFILKV